MSKIFMPIIDNGMGLSRTSWAMSLAAACISVLSKHDVTFRSISFPYPDGSMNIATEEFLASDCEEMIVIDTDIIFKEEQLAQLLSHNVPLVFGLYPKKIPGVTFPMVPLDGDTDPFCMTDGRPILREMKRVAKGFMRVHRSVFEDLKPHVPFEFSELNDRQQHLFWNCLPGGHSEDFSFCDRYRSIGGKVMVDISLCTYHEGSCVYPIKGTYEEKAA